MTPIVLTIAASVVAGVIVAYTATAITDLVLDRMYPRSAR